MDAAVRVERPLTRDGRNCYRVSNGEVELIVTGDVGPRVIRFAFVGGQNLFKEYPEQLGKSGEEKFQLSWWRSGLEGSRRPVATWAPDNVPVDIQVTPRGTDCPRARGAAHRSAGRRSKSAMASSGTGVTVIHRIANHALFPLEFSPGCSP